MTARPERPTRLLIAGGGTGGHLFPGVAIAEELRAREPDAAVRFVGTERGIEARVLPELGWELALLQARRRIKEFAPDVVIGVGGYASGPVVLAAKLRGVPTAICEQNSIPGLTNKILGKLVRRVFLSFEESRRFFKPKKIAMTGNPVRRGLAARLLAASEAPRADDAPLAVLVSGGSLGAVAVNDLAANA